MTDEKARRRAAAVKRMQQALGRAALADARKAPDMTLTPNTPFTAAELDAWRRALEAGRPAPIGDDEWRRFPQVDSFAPAATNVGLALRLTLPGGETQDLLLNPIAARQLAAAILSMGQQAGWLDKAANVIAPPLFDA